MAEQDATRFLVDRAKSGDRAAFDALAEKCRPRLRDSIRSWTRFQLGPPLDVEEVLQETFIRAFRSLGRFSWEGEDAFFRWLCGIAKHAVAQAAQERRRAVKMKSASSFGGVPAGGPTQSQALRREERFDRLERSLEKLRPEHRQVLLLSRIQGLTMKEIAERMGRSPRAVKYFLSCALREFKKRFGDTESLHLPDRRLDAGGDRDEG